MSEIARIRQQIAEECDASWCALHGLAAGWAQHEVIRQRFKNMEICRLRLTELIGEEQATEMLCRVYDEVGNKQEKKREV